MTLYVGPIEFNNQQSAVDFCYLNNLSPTLVHHSPLTMKKLKTIKSLTLPCDPTDVIDDQMILDQISKYLLEMLGESDGSGFDLNKNQRDLFFVNGCLSYTLNSDKLKIEFD